MATATETAVDSRAGQSSAGFDGPRALRLLICAVCFASATFQQGIVPLLPVYAHRFGLSGLQTGMLLAATALSTMAVSLPAGALADRLGARRLTIVAGWLMALAMLAEAFAPSFSFLLLARLVFGVGYGIVWTAGLTWLAGVSPDGSGLGATVACSGVGGIVGPVLAGSLAGLVGLAVPFYAAALVFVALTALLTVMRLPSPAPQPAPSGFRQSAGGMLRNRGIVAATAAVVIAGLTWSVTYLIAPEELHAGGISTATIGLVLSAAAAVFVIGSTATTSLGVRAIRSKWILLVHRGGGLRLRPWHLELDARGRHGHDLCHRHRPLGPVERLLPARRPRRRADGARRRRRNGLLTGGLGNDIGDQPARRRRPARLRRPSRHPRTRLRGLPGRAGCHRGLDVPAPGECLAAGDGRAPPTST